MLHYILENDALDGRLAGYATVLHPAETLEQVLVDPTLKTRLVNLCQRWFSQPPSGRQPFVFYFQGPYGVGKRDLALGLCAQWGRPLLYVDMELLLAREPDVATALRLVFREGLLWDAAIYLDHCDVAIARRREGQSLGENARAAGGRVWSTHLSGGRTPLVSAGSL